MTSDDTAGQWIKATDAAARLGVTSRALAKGRTSGRIPADLIKQQSARKFEYLWPDLQRAWEASRDPTETLKIQAATNEEAATLVEPDGGSSAPDAGQSPNAGAGQLDPHIAQARELKFEREKLALEEAKMKHRIRAGELIEVADLEEAVVRLGEVLLQPLVMFARRAEETAALKQGDKASHRSVWEGAATDYRGTVALALKKLTELGGLDDARQGDDSDRGGVGQPDRAAG